MKIKTITITGILVAFAFGGCQKYLENTRLPLNSVSAKDVYVNDEMTSAVVTGIFLSISNAGSFISAGTPDLSAVMSLYTDENKALTNSSSAYVFYKNSIQPANSHYWKDMYQKIFMINTAITGITTTSANLKYKDQWLGECYFLRGFYYFYLVNIYGAVPLALTDDYTVNNKLFRSAEEDVYQQIVSDLKLAKAMLNTAYKDGNGMTTVNRFRPNKAVVSSLLARVYLYMKEWKKAELEATEVINNTDYKLVALNDVFLANSKETIWCLATSTPKRTVFYTTYNNGMPASLSGTQTPANFAVTQATSDDLLNVFEVKDARLTSWIRTVTKAATATQPALTYQFPDKYKSAVNNAEYNVMFRLAEQYLIRAEAKAMLNDQTAEQDLNLVRNRANLDDLHPVDLLASIYKERQTELFTEGGHRFFDLKRTGRLNQIMSEAALIKSSTWESYMAYWPIPSVDLIQNPNLTPNPGYIQ